MNTPDTLRPGLLVSLKTSISGNVSYAKKTIEENHIGDDGAARERWETERTVTDPADLERAQKARSRANTLIRGVCAHSAFGLLCPHDRAADLEKAVTEARAVADAFNRTSNLSRVSVYVITGKIAADDAEAVKAIKSEIRELMEDMERGVRNTNVKTIRDAADKAKQLGAMLSADGQARVEIAIEVARKAARQIAKAGETAAVEIDRLTIQKIASQRTAFLDLEEQGTIQAPAGASRALDLEPTAPVAAPVAPVAALDLEIEAVKAEDRTLAEANAFTGTVE